MTDFDRLVRIAARSLSRAGLVHAYGHCSVRVDDNSFLVCPPEPMGLIAVGAPCTEVPVSGPLPDGVLGEVRLHQNLYKTRPDVGGVVRFMGPNVMALGALGIIPKMRHGFGTYFAPKVRFWNDIQLIRDDKKAQGAIATMGKNAGLLMRGNGAVVCGKTLQEAVVLAWYLEDMCRVELIAQSVGQVELPEITVEEAKTRATYSGRIIERMWEHLSADDPEKEI